MTKIKCKSCGYEYEIDGTQVNEPYIQCPNPRCAKISINPLKKNDTR